MVPRAPSCAPCPAQRPPCAQSVCACGLQCGKVRTPFTTTTTAPQLPRPRHGMAWAPLLFHFLSGHNLSVLRALHPVVPCWAAKGGNPCALYRPAQGHVRHNVPCAAAAGLCNERFQSVC